MVASEDIGRRDIRRGQTECEWFLYLIHLLGIVVECFAHLVAKVGVDIFIAYYLYRAIHAYGAVVGGNHHFIAFFGNSSEEFERGRVLKPRFGNAAISSIAVGEFANHFRLGAGVRQHIHKVEHHHI